MRRILLSLVLFCGCRTYEDAVKWGDSTVGSDTAVTDADGDGWSADNDCDDEDPYVHPEADEICNGIDDDCSGEVDDNALDALSWYVDGDGDGYGDESTEEISCESISGSVEAVPEGFDCDDQNPEIHPGALETDCSDPTDYNCDGSVAYDDADGDGWPACEECDDSDAAINPDAIEVCDEIDNDCDGDIDDQDEGVDLETGSTWYADADGDGYGTGEITITACAPPSGYLGDDTDCDDADADIHPAAIEICDGIDNDCDGDIDDEDANVDLSGGITFYADFDEDGFGDPDDSVLQCEAPSGYVADGSDCDDADSDTWPGAEEYCDGEDDDCDGDIDEDDAVDASTWYQDADNDAYGNAAETTTACEEPSGYVSDDTDCDDTDGATWPGADEYCDGHDDDCDGDIDEDDAVDVSTWYADTDGDGYGDASSSTLSCSQPSGYLSDATDCDDTEGSTHPGADEYCDGHDDNCDGDVDEDSAVDVSTWYADGDGDGYGDATISDIDCSAPSNYVADATDCLDTDAAIHPDADEYCNGQDDDCDGVIDEDDAVDASTWYADTDADSYGDATNSTLSCSQPSGYLSDASDCDDSASATYPGATEYCDSVDTDCDGTLDEDDAVDASTWYTDSDGDGFGTSSGSTQACDQPSGYAASTSDCDDSDGNISPGATEVCANATDENCDGNYSEGCSQQYVSCGGPGAMGPGNTQSCSVGTTAVIEGVYISVGCNDGETASYTLSFEDGGSESVGASCGSTSSFSDHLSNSVSLYMNSGGGGDSWISFTCCGSGGWGIYYR